MTGIMLPLIRTGLPSASMLFSMTIGLSLKRKFLIGYLISPFDLTAMADRVVAIAKDENINTLMARVLENARRFHIDTVGEAWQQLFDECIQSESGHH